MDIKPCYKKQEAKETSNTGAKNDEKVPSGALRRLAVQDALQKKWAYIH